MSLGHRDKLRDRLAEADMCRCDFVAIDGDDTTLANCLVDCRQCQHRSFQ